MWFFYLKELLFVKKWLAILFLLSLTQSWLFVTIAHKQTAFFEGLSADLMTAVTLYTYLLVIASRGLLLFLKKSLQDFCVISCHRQWLFVWRETLKNACAVQRAQLISHDLKQWLNFLLKQGSICMEDLLQLAFFMPLLLKGLKIFGYGAMVPLICYVIVLNILTYVIQKKAIAIEQRKDRLEAYWHARIYRKNFISDSSLQRYQKMLFKIYVLQRLIDLFDMFQQVGLLLLPALLLYNPILSGAIKIQDYVLFSQVIYNLIPAMTHVSVHRAGWAIGWASGKRLYEALSSSRKFSAQSSNERLALA